MKIKFSIGYWGRHPLVCHSILPKKFEGLRRPGKEGCGLSPQEKSLKPSGTPANYSVRPVVTEGNRLVSMFHQ